MRKTKYEDLSGKKFGKLTVVGLSGTQIHKMPGWLCKCDCGGKKIVARYHLTKGSVTSCGCKITYTTERFIEDARKVHGDFYIYDKSEYKGSQEFLTITCPIHDDFEQRPAIHLSGSGCQKCAAMRMGAAHALTAEEFDRKAKELRDDFSYDLRDYKLSTVTMNFNCKTHGTAHSQKPIAYLAGNIACKECRGLVHSKESFIKKAKEIHGDKYDYSSGEYLGTKKHFTIVCDQGHIFSQTPHNHTAGKHGCPSCGPCGFDARKDSWIYVLSAKGMSKIGITNRSAKIRAKSISKDSGIDFKVEVEYKLDGQFCSDLETELLKKYRLSYQKPSWLFQGSSECFLELSVDTIKMDIEEGIRKYEQKESLRPGE